MSTEKLIGIKNVSKKNKPVRDTVAGTALVWDDTKTVHYVNEKLAAAFLKYPDVWASAGTKVGKAAPEAEALEVPAKKEQEELPPLVNLAGMEPEALIAFAQAQFGQRLPSNMKPENMRTRITNWMNSPVVGG